MKKFSAILLVFAVLFSFAACEGGLGGETTTKRQYYKEYGETIVFENPNLTVPEALFQIVNEKDYSKKESDPNTTQSSGVTMIQKRYTLNKDNSNPIPVKVTSGATQMLLNKTVLKDVVSGGWKYVGKINETTSVGAGKGSSVFLTNSEGKMLKLSVINRTAETVAIGDCVIVEVGVTKTVQTEGGWADFTLGNTVKTDANYETVVKELGAPHKINVVERYKGNNFNFCSVNLIYEKQAGDVKYSVSVSYKDDGKTSTLESLIVTAK